MIVLMIIILTSGCVISGQGSYCSIAKPIYVSPDDILTPQTKRAIVNHSDKWLCVCKGIDCPK